MRKKNYSVNEQFSCREVQIFLELAVCCWYLKCFTFIISVVTTPFKGNHLTYSISHKLPLPSVPFSPANTSLLHISSALALCRHCWNWKGNFCLRFLTTSQQGREAKMPCYCPLVHMERGLHGGISGGLGNLSLVFLIVQPQNIHTVGFPAPMLQQSPQNDEWNEALPHHHQYDPIAMNSIMMHSVTMTSECWLGDLDSMHYFSF